MRASLNLHPTSRRRGVTRIEVDIARPRADALALRYVVTGAVNDLHLPPAGAQARADDLWRRTCFEAFVRTSPGAAYFEFNFAPSTRWAAYGFSGYRAGMQTVSEIAAPRIEVERSDTHFELRASIDLAGAAADLGEATWGVSLCAVVEDAGGRLSYWALAHPPGKADFHHPDAFALELPRTAPR